MKGLVTVNGATSNACFTTYLEARDADTLGSVLPSLMNMSGEAGSAPVVLIDGKPAKAEDTVKAIGLHEGSWISIASDAQAATRLVDPLVHAPRSNDDLQLRIIGGADAGKVFDITPGIIVLSDVLDPAKNSRLADLMLDVKSAEDVTVIPKVRETVVGFKRRLFRVQKKSEMHSDIFIGDDELVSPRALKLGEEIVLPECILSVTSGIDGSRVVMERTDNGLKYARPPKIGSHATKKSYTLPSEPQRPQRAPLPIMSILLPVLMAALMVYMMHNIRYCLFAAMTPIMMISSYITGNHSSQKQYKLQMKRFKESTARIHEQVGKAIKAESEDMRREYPDPSQVFDACLQPTDRLWNRRPTDDSWLRLRVGTGEIDSLVTLQDPSKMEFERTQKWKLQHSPVTFSLVDSRCVGCSGSPDVLYPLAQWMVIQLAALHSCSDLSLYLLAPQRKDTGTRKCDWSFVQWIPHFKPLFGQRTVRCVGSTTEELALRISELVNLLDQRVADNKERVQKRWSGSSIVVVIEHPQMLRSMPGMVRLLQEGPGVGIYSLCIAEDMRQLPEECQTVVLAEGSDVQIRSNVAQDVYDIMADVIPDRWAEIVARSLAPIEDGSPNDEDSGVPTQSRLLDLLNLRAPTGQEIASRWDMSPQSTSCMIGESVSGPFRLDIRRDGPHGLVGGTTGSGKSELLQSLVASLSVANRPDAMNFVLVDYKGGAAFKDCVKLPHTVGMVTDLDNHLVKRALDSLGAELTHREHVLSKVGAKDIEDYSDMRAKNPSIAPLPRLLIVIDEFASLVRELPDFVKGLVNIAQRGRSLGIHLLLATQRPAGVVSPEIRANTNLRIALRMTDASESQDVIDAKDAALISKSTPGRAVVRLGSNSLIPFQSARVGGRYIDPKKNKAQAVVRPFAHAIGFDDLGKPTPQRPESKKSKGDVDVTDLKVLVDAINDATKLVGIPEQRKPWLPALDTELPLDSLKFDRQDHVVIPFGLGDFPKQQMQIPISFDAASTGNMFIIGSARSGKSTLLRTMAFSASRLYSPAELQIQCIDAGGGAIASLVALPNVGNVVPRTQADKVTHLIHKLELLRAERAATFSAGGFGSLGEYNKSVPEDRRLAHVLVFLDSWDGYMAELSNYDGGSLIDRLQVLMREGTSVGLHFIVTGDSALRSGRMQSFAECKVLLRLVDKSDYMLVGMSSRDVPDKIPDGRGYRSGDTAEFQVALIGGEADGQKQMELIRAEGQRLRDGRDRNLSPRNAPFVVAELPQELSMKQMHDAIRDDDAALHVGCIPFGWYGEDNETLWLNPRAMSCLPIYGTSRSGKTNALALIAREASQRGMHMVVGARPRSTALLGLRDLPGVDHVFRQPEDMTMEIMEPFMKDPDNLIILDDCSYFGKAPCKDLIAQLLAEDDPSANPCLVVGLGVGDRGEFGTWIGELRKKGYGIVLRPDDTADGTLISMRLRPQQVKTKLPVGRGFVNIAGFNGALQVAEDESSAVAKNAFASLPMGGAL